MNLPSVSRVGSVPLLLAACAAFLVGAAARAGEAAPTPTGRVRAGDAAPPFALKPVDGGEARTLAQLDHDPSRRGVVVVFLSCRCPYVAQARQPLSDLFQRYGAKVAFVGINSNQNEAADDVKADAARSFGFPILRDEGAEVADRYGAARTPEVFLVDGGGIVRYHGGVADLSAALADFSAGRAPAKPEAKAFGCTIKRKA